ncbi:UNVERIFIED_CONTAM: hypothetical protein NCL1_63563 [Trichonephila clavipes]
MDIYATFTKTKLSLKMEI